MGTANQSYVQKCLTLLLICVVVIEQNAVRISATAAQLPDNFLIVADWRNSSMYLLDIETPNYVNIPVTRIDTPVSINYDPSTETIYWADWELNEIRMTSIHGHTEATLLPVHSVGGISLDSMSRVLFYTDFHDDDIVAINMDGSYSTKLDIKGLVKPYAIAVDVFNATLYWSSAGEDPTISTALYDGSNTKDIITTGLSYTCAITLDVLGGRIFWADLSLGIIEVALVDGSKRRTLMKASSSILTGVAVFQNVLFYTIDNFRSVMQIHINDSKTTVFGPEVFHKLYSIYAHSGEHKVSKRLLEGIMHGMLNNVTLENVQMNTSTDKTTGRLVVTVSPVSSHVMVSLQAVIPEVCTVIGWMFATPKRFSGLSLTGGTCTRYVTLQYTTGHNVTIQQTFHGRTRGVVSVTTHITGTVPQIDSRAFITVLADTSDLYHQPHPGILTSSAERRYTYGNTTLKCTMRQGISYGASVSIMAGSLNLSQSNGVVVLDGSKSVLRLVVSGTVSTVEVILRQDVFAILSQLYIWNITAICVSVSCRCTEAVSDETAHATTSDSVKQDGNNEPGDRSAVVYVCMISGSVIVTALIVGVVCHRMKSRDADPTREQTHVIGGHSHGEVGSGTTADGVRSDVKHDGGFDVLNDAGNDVNVTNESQDHHLASDDYDSCRNSESCGVSGQLH